MNFTFCVYYRSTDEFNHYLNSFRRRRRRFTLRPLLPFLTNFSGLVLCLRRVSLGLVIGATAHGHVGTLAATPARLPVTGGDGGRVQGRGLRALVLLLLLVILNHTLTLTPSLSPCPTLFRRGGLVGGTGG